MTRAITAEEILDKLDELLVMHAKGFLGSMGQRPYKDDFILLCWAAHRCRYFRTEITPRLTGDSIRDSMWSRHRGDSATFKKTLADGLEDFVSRWDEWRFAFDYSAPQLRAKSGGTRPRRRTIGPRSRKAT